MAKENIFYSKEARWFFKEKPSQLETWFNGHGAFFENEKERTDFYLSVSPAENISYKLREGKTEIKLCEQAAEAVIFPNRKFLIPCSSMRFKNHVNLLEVPSGRKPRTFSISS